MTGRLERFKPDSREASRSQRRAAMLLRRKEIGVLKTAGMEPRPAAKRGHEARCRERRQAAGMKSDGASLRDVFRRRLQE